MSPEPTREEKIRDEVKMLLERGFFDMQSGQIIVNKNNGVIQDMKFITTSYRRGKGLDTNP
jgi:hypothetical protein